MAEKVIELPVKVYRQRGENTFEVGILGRKIERVLPDGRLEASQVYRHYILYSGEVEAATVRRSGVRTPSIDSMIAALDAGGSVSFTPEKFTTDAISLPYPVGTRAEVIQPSAQDAAQGRKPILRLRVPVKSTQ